MNLLHWHRVFDDCTDLDGIRARWHAAAQEWHLNPAYETPEYRDAILSFIAASPLPASLKLGALLVCVSGFDFDLRLAAGALDDVDDETASAWPAVFADAAELLGPCPMFAARDPALAHFAHGRLSSVRDALRWNRESHAQWRDTFWNAYLELACRWADPGAFGLALERGAQPGQIMPRVLEVLAEGIHSPVADARYYTDGRSNADYLVLIDRLRESGLDLHQESAIVLPTAARAGNTDMLEHLVARGASLATAGRDALTAAASTAALDAAEWLIAHGVNGAAELDVALVEAVATLDETMTDLLLDAGADVHAADEQPLCTACAARPVDLYNGETVFVRQRADMILLLMARGANLGHPRFIASLRHAGDGQAVLAELLSRPDLEASHRRALVAIGAPSA
ncbi:MAG: hypothetical protein ACXWC4_22115 [Telluria sp.]